MNINTSFKFDWIDSVLIAFGFVLFITVSTFLSSYGYEDSVVFKLITAPEIALFAYVLGPGVIRRLLFGQPNLPPLKEGNIWPFVSAVSLLLVFAGMGGLFLAGLQFKYAYSKTPNFLEESKTFHSTLTDYSRLIPKVKYSHETMKQFQARLAKEEQQHKDRKAKSIVNYAKEKKQEWKKRRARLQKKGFRFAGVGGLLILLGTLGIRWRYDRRVLEGDVVAVE